MSRVPNGVPTVTYCRLMPSTVSMTQGDVVADGNAVVVLEPGQPSARFEVAQVLDKSLSDEEVCEMTFGSRAGAGLGSVLNPVSAFVNDAANVVIMLTGSKMSKKWQFLKRCFLPFIANEILTTISDRSQQAPSNFYKAQLTVSAFEMQDEIIGDLLRPANRGLPIANTLEDGVVVQGLHKETVVDEVTLRRLLVEACDNRAVYGLPVGGSIETSTGVFEFRLYQAEPLGQGQNVFQTQECYSKLVVIDVPSIDPLAATNIEEVRLLSGPTLHKSLLTLLEVAKKLNNPYRAQLAPFRSSKLTHYVSEMLGGNAIVVALAQVCSGEPQVSRRTLDFMSYLNSAVHYPMGAREFSDTLRGLLGKYRAMLMHLSDELNNTTTSANSSHDQQTELITMLQQELAKSVSEMNSAIEDRARIFEMSELLKAKYNTLMDEKLKQSEDLAQSEEDNIALAKEIVEHELAHAQAMEKAEGEKMALESELVTVEAQLESLTAELNEAQQKRSVLEVQVTNDSKEISSKQLQIEDLFRQLHDKNNEFSEQKEKNIELGAELLTLVNHKDVLQKDLDELQTKQRGIDSVLHEHQSKQKDAELEIRRLLEKLVGKDEEIMELRKNKYLNKKGNDLNSTTSLETTDPSNSNVSKAVENMRLAVDQKKERQFIRQIQSLEKQLRRMEADYQSTKKEKEQNGKELTELRNKYRALLQESYNQSNNNASQEKKDEPVAAISTRSDKEDDPLSALHVHYNLQSLMSSYQEQEVSLAASYEEAVQSRAEAIEAYRQLYDHYRHSLDIVEDMMAIVQDKYSDTISGGREAKEGSSGKKGQLDARIKKMLEETLAEQFQFASNVLPNAEKLLSDMEDPRSKFGKKDLPGQNRDRNDTDNKERIAAVIATYQHSLQQAEGKLAQAMQENIELKIQVKQLINNSNKSFKQNNTDPENTSMKSITNSQYQQALTEQTQTLTQQYQAMYENLTKEILSLKKELNITQEREQSLKQVLSNSNIHSRAPSASATRGGVGEIGSSNKIGASVVAEALEKKVTVPYLHLPNAEDSHTNQFVQPPEHVHHAHHHPHQNAALKALEEEKQQLRSQLLLSEQRAAQLSADHIGIEEELKAYKEYMKEILPQYQKLMQQQKKTSQNLSNSLLSLNSGSHLGVLSTTPLAGNAGNASRSSGTSLAAAKEILRSSSANSTK